MTKHALVESPMDTPWGPALYQQMQIAPGVWFVGTPLHGGLLLTARAADRLLSRRAQRIGHWWHRYLTLEEDCEMAVFIYEQPELYVRAGEAITADPAKVSEVRTRAEGTVRFFFPDYFEGA